MNVELLQRVKQAILADPESFDMVRETQCIAAKTGQITRACYGLNGAARELDLTREQARELMVPDWDWEDWGPYGDRMAHSSPSWMGAIRPDAQEHAKVAAEFIDYFIAKHSPPVVTSGVETEMEVVA